MRDSDITKAVMAEVDSALVYWKKHGLSAIQVARACELRNWTRITTWDELRPPLARFYAEFNMVTIKEIK